ncbi:MAG TPA: hypothetical protein VGH72_33945 [Pseudonocardia sp.]|jgi:hypothetical protein
MVLSRPHDPFSPHKPVRQRKRPPDFAARKDDALKALAIEQHAAEPEPVAEPPRKRKSAAGRKPRKPRPTEAEVAAAVAKLEA